MNLSLAGRQAHLLWKEENERSTNFQQGLTEPDARATADPCESRFSFTSNRAIGFFAYICCGLRHGNELDRGTSGPLECIIGNA